MAPFTAPAKFSAMSWSLLRRRSASQECCSAAYTLSCLCVCYFIAMKQTGLTTWLHCFCNDDPCRSGNAIMQIWQRAIDAGKRGTSAKVLSQLFSGVPRDALYLLLDVVQLCEHATADAINQAGEVKRQQACRSDLL